MTKQPISILEPAALETRLERVNRGADLIAGPQLDHLVELEPASTLECSLPVFVDHPESELRFFFGKPASEFNLQYHFKPAFLAVLDRARLVGPYVVVSRDRYIIEDSYTGEHVLQRSDHFLPRTMRVEFGGGSQELPFVLFRPRGEPLAVEQPCVLSTDYWHFNYHHWLIECLPRLRRALEEADMTNAAVILPGRLSSFQRESLDLLGLAQDRWLLFDESDWQIERLYFPSVGNFSPVQLAWVRERCLAGLGIESDSRPEGLYYISRTDASVRRVVNEDEIVAFLESQGFNCVQLTGIPFAEQVEMFCRARAIVGPHGSGLTNTIFGSSELTLVELMPDDEVNHCFWLMANSRGQRYTFVVGRTIAAHRDFEIPLDRLKQVLAAVL